MVGVLGIAQTRARFLKMVNYHLLVPPPTQKHVVLDDLPRRLVVVGDVHGCLEELKELLQTCSYDRSLGDRVLLLGDLVNKGPLSAETIQYAKSEGFLSIRGNHDDFALCHALKLVDAPRPPALDYLDKLSRYLLVCLTVCHLRWSHILKQG